jgi:hypothetical protein
MKVRILSPISHDGQPLAEGDVRDVEQATGEKWVSIGAAELAAESATPAPLAPPSAAGDSQAQSGQVPAGQQATPAPAQTPPTQSGIPQVDPNLAKKIQQDMQNLDGGSDATTPSIG